jgi:transcriptional regulator with GAF, ATPase, and Fis domain
MEEKLRYKRLRQLVSKVNKARKKQAKKIDLIKSLSSFSFAANFYESIIAKTDLKELLSVAGRLIKERIGDVNIVFFIRQQDGFEMHAVGSIQTSSSQNLQLESYFTNELVENICQSNKLCALDEMLEMGLQAGPNFLNKISAVTIPLSISGTSHGFILIYQGSDQKLSRDDISSIASVAPGLARAINCSKAISCRDKSCQN